jgi:predicted DNA-binding transcriptional regulator YafY
MKQLDRQLLILTRLREKRAVTARNLAAACECSVRTIYRDVNSLCEAGVPVAAMPGEGYRLAAGYHLPPVALTPEEASQLLLGADVARDLGTSSQRLATESAVAKISAVLPDATEEEVERRRERITVRWSHRDTSPWFPLALQAVLDERVLRIRYHAYTTDRSTRRDIEPHQLTFYGDDWHLIAYCRLRRGYRGYRDFRLARIDDAELTAERFQRPDQIEGDHEPADSDEQVRVWLSSSAARWAREDPAFGFKSEEPAEGGAIFIFNLWDASRLTAWILGWGASARVLSPPDFVAKLRDEAEALVRLYSS